MKTGIEQWLELDGDNTLALDWPLTEDSHVWEIGGFEGRWAQQIWDKFHCHITIYEPQLWAVQKLMNRFLGIKKIDIRPYGLWMHDGSFPMGNFFTDGASLLKTNPPVENTSLFKHFYLDFRNLTYQIDVCLMNIEGAEYFLIPDFIGSGAMQNIDNFWCQFHPVSADELDQKFMDIFKRMDETHECIWNCYPTAVAWKKR